MFLFILRSNDTNPYFTIGNGRNTLDFFFHDFNEGGFSFISEEILLEDLTEPRLRVEKTVLPYIFLRGEDG